MCHLQKINFGNENCENLKISKNLKMGLLAGVPKRNAVLNSKNKKIEKNFKNEKSEKIKILRK